MPFTEDTLVQQTTADYLRERLAWETVYAYNNEILGPEGTLGRRDEREVVLTRYLGEALVKLNPGLPQGAYQEALRQISEYSRAQTLLQINREKHDLLRDGVQVQIRNDDGELEIRRLRVFDFEAPENNHFLGVRELWIKGDLYRRRPDLIGFVNGLPLVFVECKNIHRDLRRAFERNLADYRTTIPQLFHHNAIILLANGATAKVGSLSNLYEHFHEWKRLAEEEPGVVDMETLLKGVLARRTLLDIFENFIVFDESGEALCKIVGRNHQFLGVNKAVHAVRERNARLGKLGVFWHTQGSGKSYSMVFFTRKVRRKLGGQFTFLVCTDRDDLDKQIYQTFAGCGLVDHDRDPCRAGSGEELRDLLSRHKAYVFSMIQKFHRDVNPEAPWSERDDVIVITDEAHRTQYGRLALNMRNALPNASYVGFTGTPLFREDEITRQVFGDYVSTYDFQRAVQDNATVPLYYDARGDKLDVALGDLNQRIAEKLDDLEIEDVNVAERLERELRRDYHVITAGERLDRIAQDFVYHYAESWESGKAMFISIDKVTCGRMHRLAAWYWDQRIAELEKELTNVTDEQELPHRQRQLAWMRETRMAAVFSEEQGEVAKFEKWGLDVRAHRILMKQGFETADGRRISVEEAFKNSRHPFRVVFVCAMWLTGFDVPSLANLYLDKPLKAHTLMQAIARANRVHAGKNNGLILDYCGILKSLREALAAFAGQSGGEGKPPNELDPVKPADEDLLAALAETIALAKGFLAARGCRLESIREAEGFGRIAVINSIKNAINESDEERKRFAILARETFKKFRACVTLSGVNAHRWDVDAINIVYKSLQKDRDAADISEIIRDLHRIVAEAIAPRTNTGSGEARLVYDISAIDFEALRKEYERRHGGLNSAVQNIKDAVEKRLARMIAQNPLRTNFQIHYEELVDAYNREKDRVMIERTFDELLKVVKALDDESRRAVAEGLDEESLTLFDLMKKEQLDKKTIARIKDVAKELLARLRSELQRYHDWRATQAARDAIRTKIHDFLYADATGLPTGSYTDAEVEFRAERIYQHVLTQYPDFESRAQVRQH